MSALNGSAKREDNALYRHYDATGRLLYIGITNDPGSRWKGHMDKTWWHYVDTTKIERFPSRAEVEAAEVAAIKAERPWWNIAHNDSMIRYRERCLTAIRFHEDWRESHNCNTAHVDGLAERHRAAFDISFNKTVAAIDDGIEDLRQTGILDGLDPEVLTWALVGVEAAQHLAGECARNHVSSIADALYSVEAVEMEAAARKAKIEAEAAERTVLNDPVMRAATRLCGHLTHRIVENGSRRPRILPSWITAARLLIEKDGVPEDEAMRVIDWCQRDEFWRCNILSMPKFRQQYPRLLMQSRRNQPERAAKAQEASPRKPVDEDAVIRLCNLLAKRMNETNDITHFRREVTVSKRWISKMTSLLRDSGATESEVVRMIEWCYANDFWSRNVRGIEKFQRTFNTLREVASKSAMNPGRSKI